MRRFSTLIFLVFSFLLNSQFSLLRAELITLPEYEEQILRDARESESKRTVIGQTKSLGAVAAVMPSSGFLVRHKKFAVIAALATGSVAFLIGNRLIAGGDGRDVEGSATGNHLAVTVVDDAPVDAKQPADFREDEFKAEAQAKAEAEESRKPEEARVKAQKLEVEKAAAEEARKEPEVQATAEAKATAKAEAGVEKKRTEEQVRKEREAQEAAEKTEAEESRKLEEARVKAQKLEDEKAAAAAEAKRREEEQARKGREIQAATRIQAHERGRQARKSFEEKKAEAELAQKREEEQKLEDEKAAAAEAKRREEEQAQGERELAAALLKIEATLKKNEVREARTGYLKKCGSEQKSPVKVTHGAGGQFVQFQDDAPELIQSELYELMLAVVQEHWSSSDVSPSAASKPLFDVDHVLENTTDFKEQLNTFELQKSAYSAYREALAAGRVGSDQMPAGTTLDDFLHQLTMLCLRIDVMQQMEARAIEKE